MHFKQFDCLPNPTQSSLKCYEEIYVLRAVTISKCFTNNITTIIIRISLLIHLDKFLNHINYMKYVKLP